LVEVKKGMAADLAHFWQGNAFACCLGLIFHYILSCANGKRVPSSRASALLLGLSCFGPRVVLPRSSGCFALVFGLSRPGLREGCLGISGVGLFGHLDKGVNRLCPKVIAIVLSLKERAGSLFCSFCW
jgi:hypothetical protein